jgi:predicted nucleic acid-binding protein
MAGLYVDTSAIGRLLLQEPDAPNIAATLVQYELWASEILTVEFRRLAARESLVNQAELLLANINLVALNAASLKRASDIPPMTVRTLDAIHLDTAVGLHNQGTIDAVLTFDKQLKEGCAHHSVHVVQPQATGS